MKVTFLSPPLNLSGGNRVVAIYSDYLRSRGHEVLVVSPPHATRSRAWSALRRYGFSRPALKAQPPSHQDAVPVARRLLSRDRPIRDADLPDADVLVATWWETALWARKMRPSKGRPVYFVQHHEVFDFMPKALVESTYRLPMQKVVVASWLAREMAQRYGDSGSIVVPNAIDPAQFFAAPRAKQPRPTVGTLFHEANFKGFDVALDVLSKVRAQRPDLRVIAFGSAEAQRYGARLEGIELVIRPEQDAIRELYSRCDVWLSCSRSEGFNLTAMEAMACRTPVVSTRTGWPEEAVVAGVNGALADVDDADALAHAVLSILALPAPAWEALSEGAARTVAGSSWEASAAQFERALLATLS
ncbi:MAG: glycosyltransferase family 4 protein [Burkholderiaceae bacterium]